MKQANLTIVIKQEGGTYTAEAEGKSLTGTREHVSVALHRLIDLAVAEVAPTCAEGKGGSHSVTNGQCTICGTRFRGGR